MKMFGIGIGKIPMGYSIGLGFIKRVNVESN